MSVCGGAFPPCAVSAPPGLLPGTSRAYPWSVCWVPPGCLGPRDRFPRAEVRGSILQNQSSMAGGGQTFRLSFPVRGEGGQTFRLAFPAGATVGRLFGWPSRRGRRWADYSVGLPGGGDGGQTTRLASPAGGRVFFIFRWSLFFAGRCTPALHRGRVRTVIFLWRPWVLGRFRPGSGG